MTAELRFDANLTWLFTELPFEERFDAAAAAGFTAVEYASPYPYSATVLKRLLADAGLTQVLINSPVSEAERLGYACLPGRTAEFRAGLELALEYAVALDCSFVHVLGGIKPDDVSHDRAFAHYVSNIAWIAEQARGTGVRLVLEAQNNRDSPGYIVGNQARATAVVKAIGMDHVGMLFDVYHAQITEPDCHRFALDHHTPGLDQVRFGQLRGGYRCCESTSRRTISPEQPSRPTRTRCGK
jgi:hydroxypyruvate isomerase